MASVFLSYDHDDHARAAPIAAALEKAGHSVWWDLHIKAGAQYTKVIDEALKGADAIVVLWSTSSVESAWVRDEAAAGRDSGRLIPALLDAIDPPLGFRQFQTIDLSRWKGRGRPVQLRTLLDDVATMAGSPMPAVPATSLVTRPRRIPAIDWRLASAAILFAAVVAALIVWRPWASPNQVPTVVVTPTGTDAGSQALARDMAVKLGNLQTVHMASMRLLSEAEGAFPKSDLILATGRLADPSAVGANVVLMTGKDRSILWSKDFEEPTRNLADLQQQTAYTAAVVLDCTAEALTAKHTRLDQPTLKRYLTACSELSARGTIKVDSIIASLAQVIRRSPRFEPAWRKLLTAEAEYIQGKLEEGSATAADLEPVREHVASARKLDPQMAEATLAEILLLPLDQLSKRMHLIDEAKENNPYNSAILTRRSDMLGAVGRMRDAVADAQRAIELDPLSPGVRGIYFMTLIYSGDTESAREELSRVKKLWPGSATSRDLEFRFQLRFGDPKVARELAVEQGIAGGMAEYFEARIDPTPANIDRFLARARQRRSLSPGWLAFVMQALGEFHREHELYDIMMRWPRTSDFLGLQNIWFRPALKTFRKDPRFMRLAARSPLLNYWRSTGNWPDFCSEPDLPYDCKAEAAKLS